MAWLPSKIAGNSVLRQGLGAVFSLFLLSSCAETPLPSWFTGEPDESVTGPASDQPGITRINQAEPAWPNLATVPDRPTVPDNASDRDPVIMRMRQDNARATAIQQSVQPYLEQSEP